MSLVRDNEQQEILTAYAAAAQRHADATESGDPEAGNDAHDQLAAIHRELRAEHRLSSLLPLLNAPDDGVRLWAASHLLFEAPERAEPVLRALETGSGILGFNAQMTLMAWRSGSLAFP